jgi:hypothetical protein
VSGSTCTSDGCDRVSLARGACRMHYLRWWRSQPPQPRQSLADRFWSKVDRSGPCWLWTGGTSNAGYGHFHPTKRQGKGAHRVAYELVRGPIPEGLELDHLCRVVTCVNPDHLEPVTHAENMRRMRERST